MATLNLTLKKYWFDMILSGEKKEEYREIKPYWMQRILLHEFSKFTPDALIEYAEKPDKFKGKIYLPFRKNYDLVIAKNGYGQFVPQLVFTPGIIRIGLPKKEWCHHDTDLEKPVFIIPIADKPTLIR